MLKHSTEMPKIDNLQFQNSLGSECHVLLQGVYFGIFTATWTHVNENDGNGEMKNKTMKRHISLNN